MPEKAGKTGAGWISRNVVFRCLLFKICHSWNMEIKDFSWKGSRNAGNIEGVPVINRSLPRLSIGLWIKINQSFVFIHLSRLHESKLRLGNIPPTLLSSVGGC